MCEISKEILNIEKFLIHLECFTLACLINLFPVNQYIIIRTLFSLEFRSKTSRTSSEENSVCCHSAKARGTSVYVSNVERESEHREV